MLGDKSYQKLFHTVTFSVVTDIWFNIRLQYFRFKLTVHVKFFTHHFLKSEISLNSLTKAVTGSCFTKRCSEMCFCLKI